VKKLRVVCYSLTLETKKNFLYASHEMVNRKKMQIQNPNWMFAIFDFFLYFLFDEKIKIYWLFLF